MIGNNFKNKKLIYLMIEGI